MYAFSVPALLLAGALFDLDDGADYRLFAIVLIFTAAIAAARLAQPGHRFRAGLAYFALVAALFYALP